MTARLSSTAGVVLASARHQILVFLRGWRTAVILGIVQPTVLLLVTISLPGRVTAAYASHEAIGVLLTSFWSFTIWTGAGILHRERNEGTLGPCLIGVRDFRLVLAGKAMGASAASGLLIVSTVSVVLGALGRSLRFDHPGWLVVGLATVFLTGIVLGVGLSSLFVLTRFGPQLSGALMYPVFLLAGLLTPISTLPSGIRWLSWGISLRWTMTFLTSAATGMPDLLALGMVVALTACYGAAAALACNRFSTLTRMNGRLDFA